MDVVPFKAVYRSCGQGKSQGTMGEEKSLSSICDLRGFASLLRVVDTCVKATISSGGQLPDWIRDTANDSVSSYFSASTFPPTWTPYFPIISPTRYSTMEGSHIKKIARVFKEQLHWERSQLKGSIRRPETHARLSSAVFCEGLAIL